MRSECTAAADAVSRRGGRWRRGCGERVRGRCGGVGRRRLSSLILLLVIWLLLMRVLLLLLLRCVVRQLAEAR